jgi:DNA-binding MarR family transcriptional regulator
LGAGRNNASYGSATKAERLALRKCLLVMDAFRAIWPIMPLQQAYAFLFVALEEGRNVQEYAKRAGITQPVMTRILFALGSTGRRAKRGYGLVQQTIDTKDARRHQTFLTAKGKALMREIVRLVRLDQQAAMKLRSGDLMIMPESSRDIAHDQLLSRLIAAGRKLDAKDSKLAVQLIEAMVSHRELERAK